MRDGFGTPKSGCEAKREEGTGGGEAQAYDRAASEEHAQRARQAGGPRSSARRSGRACARGSQSPAAVRDRQGQEHPRPLEDGQVGSDQGDPQGPLSKRKGALKCPRRSTYAASATKSSASTASSTDCSLARSTRRSRGAPSATCCSCTSR